jgi:Ca2+-binding RTX toxin-like protein
VADGAWIFAEPRLRLVGRPDGLRHCGGSRPLWREYQLPYRRRHLRCSDTPTGQLDEFLAIWDAGGTDEIVYAGRFKAVIDLREATLENGQGGGGFVSYAKGAPSTRLDHWNAITIANGVTIENAKGGKGNDKIIGNEEDNRLAGGGGRDKLRAGPGDNVLVGGRGRDKLHGGSGEDVFDFNSVAQSRKGDVIKKFERGQDEIDLQSIDAKKGGGNQDFRWIGKKGFHDKKGELHYQDLGKKVLVEGDVDGDGHADFCTKVKVGNIGSDDFIL